MLVKITGFLAEQFLATSIFQLLRLKQSSPDIDNSVNKTNPILRNLLIYTYNQLI